ncbi:MAG: 30S ribosomal protein S2 [Desulfovibrio sp.]|nr:MAG: 30S ribosomal protein S2 [Desulfovibrio sp.]
MAYVTMKQMLETGVHFGHQTRRWNPKMRPYIYGARNGIHIIDLQQTVKLFQKAHDLLVDTVASGGKVIFVGTKRQAQESVTKEASRAEMYYVTNRWMGGTLTNFQTIRKSIDRLHKLEKMFEDGTVNRFLKKEILRFQREMDKLNALLGGIKDMDTLPQLAFIIDPKREDIAVKECRKLGIPIVAVVDTNCDPDLIDHVIPGNDDAIRAIKLFVTAMADACLEGAARREEQAQDKDEVKKVDAPKAEAPKAEAPKAKEPKPEEPKAEEPKAEAPKEEAKAEAPAEETKTEEPKAEEPKQEDAATETATE